MATATLTRPITRTINGTEYALGETISADDVRAQYPDFAAGAEAPIFSAANDATTMSQFFNTDLDWPQMHAAILAVVARGNILLVRGGNYSPKHKGDYYLARSTGMVDARQPDMDPAFRISDGEHSWEVYTESFIAI